MIKEERKSNDLHFCYSADGIAEALADALSAEVEKRNGNVRDYIYFAGMGDWYGGQCQCEKCRKIYEEETWTNPDGKAIPGYSATLLRMINRTAELLEKKYPGITIGTFAYMSLDAPPAKTVPRENVIIYAPRLRYCGAHPVDACPKNRSFWLSLERWNQIAPGRVYVWEYGTYFPNFLYPYPALNTMADNIKAYHKLGIAGLMIQCNYVSTGGDMAVMKNYVWSRLLRDPSLDTATLIRDFTDRYYGPAGPDVRRYVDTLEGVFNKPEPIHVHELTDNYASFLTRETRETLKEILAQARKKVGAPDQADYRRRVDELAAGMEVLELWADGPLMERDGKLIRRDFGYDTMPRALAMSRNTRNSAITEFGLGASYLQSFFQRHGGPIARLTNGDLTVAAIPARGASIGPVTLGEEQVITKSWFNPVRYGVFEGKPGEGGVLRMSGDSGIGAWSPDTKHILSQEVRLADDHTITIDSSIKRVAKAANFESASIPISTVYPILKTTKNVEFAWRDTSGAWHVVEDRPASSRAPVEINGPIAAWRVTLPGAVIVDEYEPLTQAGPPKDDKEQKAAAKNAAPPLSGQLGIGRDSRFFTQVTMEAGGLEMDKTVPWLRRTIQVTKEGAFLSPN